MAIRQTISLDGLQTVQSELKNLADVGESAFARIRSAVEGGGGGLEAIANNILNIGKALTSLTGAVTVFAGITAGLVGLTVSASNAGEEFENLGTQLGTTTDTASALISSFARAGADVQGLAGQLRRAAVNISNEFAQIQTSVREAGLKTISNNLAVAQSFNNLAKVNVAAAEQEHNAALQRQADALAVVDAQANLDDLLEKQRIRQGGIRDPQLEADRAVAREEQQIAKARLQLAQAEQKAKEDAALATQRAAEQELAAQTARLAAAKALQQAREDEKNSITNLVGFVTDLANGLTNTGRAVNATVDNLFKGIIASAAGLDASLGPIEGDISNIASPTVLNVLLKLSDVLKNMHSETEKTALASKLLGRTVGQEEVAFLSQGSKAIQDHINVVKALGLEFSTGMAEATQKFRVSLFTLEDTLSRIKDQIGATFAPVFGPFFQVLADLLAENRQLFVGWAQTLADTVKPTLDSIIRVLSGKETIDDKWLTDLIDRFKNLATAISDIVVPAFKAFIGVLDQVARSINSIFGTSLDSTSLLAIAWVTKITGAFSLIGVAITALSGLFAALAVAIGTPLAIATAAVVAFTLAIIGIGAALGNEAALKMLKQDAEDVARIFKAIPQAIIGFFDGIKASIEGLRKDISEIKTLGDLFAKIWEKTFIIKIEPQVAWERLTELLLGPPGSPLRRILLGEEAPAIAVAPGEKVGPPPIDINQLQKKSAEDFAAAEKKAADETKRTTDEIKAADAAARAWGETGQTSATKIVTAASAGTSALKLFEDQAKKSAEAIKFLQAPEPGVQPTAGKAGFVSVDQLGVSAVEAAKKLTTTTVPGAPTQEQAQQQAQGLVQVFQAAAEKIQQIWNSLKDALDAVDFSSIISSDEIVGPFLDAEEGILAVFEAIAAEAERMAQRIIQAAQQAAQALRDMQSAGGGFGGQAEGAPFAGGGRVLGPGSWTSDSIPARLSRDEFVQPAFRVHQYGMDFMEAIRRGLLSTDAVRMLMGDLRGLASGGLANGGSSSVINRTIETFRNEFVQPIVYQFTAYNEFVQPIQKYSSDFLETIRDRIETFRHEFVQPISQREVVQQPIQYFIETIKRGTDIVQSFAGDFHKFNFGGKSNNNTLINNIVNKIVDYYVSQYRNYRNDAFINNKNSDYSVSQSRNHTNVDQSRVDQSRNDTSVGNVVNKITDYFSSQTRDTVNTIRTSDYYINQSRNDLINQSRNDTSVDNVVNRVTDYFANQAHDTVNHIINQIINKTFATTRTISNDRVVNQTSDDVNQTINNINTLSQNEFIQPVLRAHQHGIDFMEAIRRSIDKLFGGLHFGFGGRVVGPGSWTSDSIPAWLSRDEFVQPAFRVQQYGMDFMEAIRRGLLSTDMVRMLMGDLRGFKFNDMPMPKFAEGGSVSSGASRTFNLILGGQTFPLTGSAKVIDTLEREAALRSMAATGIPQSFVGRR